MRRCGSFVRAVAHKQQRGIGSTSGGSSPLTSEDLTRRFQEVQAARRRSANAAENSAATVQRSVYGVTPGSVDRTDLDVKAQSVSRGSEKGSGAASAFLRERVQHQQKDKEKEKAAASSAAFVGRVNNLHRDYFTRRRDQNHTLKVESKAAEKMGVRRSMLTFRNVDTDLDKMKVQRDLFLWIRCLRRGTDYLIDMALERELRFYSDDAMQEIRVARKLFQGLPTLSKPAQKFPLIRDAVRLGSMPKHVGDAKKDSGNRLLGSAAATSNDRFLFTADAFKRPTLVTVSPLTFGMVNGDEDWITLLDPRRRIAGAADAESELSEAVIQSATNNAAILGAEDRAAKLQDDENLRARMEEAIGIKHSGDVDVLRIKSAENVSVKWLLGSVMKQYAGHIPYNEARNTIAATNVTREFMPQFGVRNFASSYVLLVDSNGFVRWMSAGLPSKEEIERFPALVAELRNEHYRRSA